MKRRWRLLRLTGAGLLGAGLAVSASASSGPAGGEGASRLRFQSLPRSLLVSAPVPAYGVAYSQAGLQRRTVLARLPASAAAEPVASFVRSAAGAQVAVQWRPAARRPALDVLTLEHLYALAIREEPTARYCLSHAPRACDAARSSVSHAQLLAQIAQAREAALARTGSAGTGAAWQGITMNPVAGAAEGPDDVAVQIVGPAREPLPGVALYFNRAPHAGCSGTSGADGVARCRLVDQHGEDGAHDDETAVPVVVTFPGQIQPARVLLPTTFVLPPRSP